MIQSAYHRLASSPTPSRVDFPSAVSRAQFGEQQTYPVACPKRKHAQEAEHFHMLCQPKPPIDPPAIVRRENVGH